MHTKNDSAVLTACIVTNGLLVAVVDVGLDKAAPDGFAIFAARTGDGGSVADTLADCDRLTGLAFSWSFAA